MEIFRRTPLDQGRLETCKTWYEFDHAVTKNDFAADLWMMLTSWEPDIHDDPVARTAFDALLEVPEIGILRKACAGDPALSAAVTVMLKDFSNAADDAIEEANQPDPQGDEQQPGAGDQEGEGEPQPGDEGDGEGEPSPGDGTPGDTGQGKGEPDKGGGKGEQKLSPGAEQSLKDAIKKAAEQYLGDGKMEQERVADLAAGFSLTGDSNPSLRDRLDIAERDLRGLKKILKLAGTLRQTSAETGRYIRASSPDARLPKPGYAGGTRALQYLDNTEIAALTGSETEQALFWQRWKNRRTRVTHSWAKVRAGAGPIVLMGDESSSMPSQEAKFPDTDPLLTPADWLSALALAISGQCETENRPFVYQAWASHVVLHRRFEAGHTARTRIGLTPQQKIEMVAGHAGGGTQLGGAVAHGIKEAQKLSRGRNVKADVIIVTDGSWHLPGFQRRELQTLMEDTKTRVHLFLVCMEVNPATLDRELWTNVIDVKDILSSTVEVGKILA
jgi:uncharacterized protein with von Willebrand factor type A (vWA) domain